MNLFELLPTDWRDFLEIDKTYFDQLDAKLPRVGINPELPLVFNAFNIAPADVKVVIIGQDPYPDFEDANGLAFSISPGRRKIPGSLRNIKKELYSDLQIENSKSGDLTPWVKQGVLLLNSILTTDSGVSLAHKDFGWEKFTNQVIEKLAVKDVIFILWGKSAQSVGNLIPNHKKIFGVHPSPLSAHRGFFGSKPFSRCNELLIELGRTPIDWRI